MTTLEAIAQREAKVTYDVARRRHERDALIAQQRNRPLTAHVEMAAARRIARYAASEVLVVHKVDQADHDNREGAWPDAS